jgi:hypothetical protein
MASDISALATKFGVQHHYCIEKSLTFHQQIITSISYRRNVRRTILQTSAYGTRPRGLYAVRWRSRAVDDGVISNQTIVYPGDP